MKNIRLIAVMLSTILSLSSCGNPSNNTTTTSTETPIASSVSAQTEASTPVAVVEDNTGKPDYWKGYNESSKAQNQTLYENRPVSLKQMEYLDRGLVAVLAENGTLISWRFLGTDSPNLSFNLYRNGEKLNSTPISDKTNYLDTSAVEDAEYTLIPVLNNTEIATEKESISTWENPYISIPVVQYEKGDYDIYDASVGDLDGDGEYEIVVRRNPADMNIRTRVAYPLLEAYKLDGTHLWTINIGPNEVNIIDINFLVYDFDGDGKAEVVMRSFEETVDGVGKKIGDIDNDGVTNYEKSIQEFKDRQYLSKGPEFLSVYNGMTGAEMARTDLLPSREPLRSWLDSSPDVGTLTKRASHFLFAVAYLDGVTPSIVHLRGAWAACKLAAWDYKSGQFKLLWETNCEGTNTLENLYSAGYHSIAVADVDYDGKDEILTGSAAIDNDGTVMYVTTAERENGKIVKLGHGDAFDVAIMSPELKGYYVWSCQETSGLPVNIGLHDARTGEIILGYTKPKDTGRSRAADIDPTNEGFELWGSTGTPLQSIYGEILSDPCPSSMNAKMYWDGDLLSELVDHNADTNMNILKWNWETKKLDTILTAKDSASNCGTKGNACLIADILGDWRDELIVRTADSKELRVYTTNIETKYRIPTLMHDFTYREAIAWQNNHYNQPANLSYYLGYETTQVPVPEIFTIKNNDKIINEVYKTSPNKHSFLKLK